MTLSLSLSASVLTVTCNLTHIPRDVFSGNVPRGYPPQLPFAELQLPCTTSKQPRLDRRRPPLPTPQEPLTSPYKDSNGSDRQCFYCSFTMEEDSSSPSGV
ncbi:hypothetical protein GW17_00027604 [Ensete ventricosum]|nr:hypothetical protein GW17_00027604 [Ensete ventricosum]